LTIIISADKKIKFYSWDDLTGGTWHHINCIAQFESYSGKIIVQQLNSENEAGAGEFTDSKVFEVNEITINKSTFYLTFAWGTHGDGNQHDIIQIFKIAGDSIVKCKSCFANNNDLAIEYPRNEKSNLTFNPETNEISYTEFKFDADEGFFKRTGQVVTLKLINGIFTVQ